MPARSLRCLAFAATLLCPMLLPAAPAHAAAQLTAIVGGAGGVPVRLNCPTDRWLYAVWLNVGAWMDTIAPMCIRLDAAGNWIRDADVWAGNAGRMGSLLGGERQYFVTCPDNTVIKGYSGSTVHTQSTAVYASDFRLTCVNPINGKTAAEVSGPRIRAGGGNLYRDWPMVGCPPGQLAKGLHGRAGNYVDQVGLVCEDAAFLNEGQIRYFGKVKIDNAKSKTGQTSGKIGDVISKLPKDVIEQARKQQQGGNQLPPSNQPPPVIGTLPDRLTYDPPLTKRGTLLYHCEGLNDQGCGQRAADRFCQQKRGRQALDFEVVRVRRSDLDVAPETLRGDQCQRRFCRVFSSITCGKVAGGGQTPSSGIAIQGTAVLRDMMQIDLDNGQQAGFGGNSGILGADFNFGTGGGGSYFGTGQNVVRSIGSPKALSQDDCRRNLTTDKSIALHQTPGGTFFCYRTDEGRLGQFRLSTVPVPGNPVGHLKVEFTTWEK